MAIITPLKKIFKWQQASEKIPYKVYTALLTQTGTANPVVNVLQNTLEFTPVFVRVNPGVYVWEFFKGKIDKTKTTFSCNWYAGTNSYKLTAFIGFESNWNTGIDAVVIESFDDTLLSDDVLGGGNTDFAGTLIEIRVYN